MEFTPAGKRYNLKIHRLGAKSKIEHDLNKTGVKLLYFALYKNQIEYQHNSTTSKIKFNIKLFSQIFNINLTHLFKLSIDKKGHQVPKIQILAQQIISTRIFTWNDSNSDPLNQLWSFYNIFDSFVYDKGVISISLSEPGRRVFSEFKNNFININIFALSHFKHKYTPELYRFLKAKANWTTKKEIKAIPYREIRDFLQINPNQYSNIRNFINKVIIPSTEEITKNCRNTYLYTKYLKSKTEYNEEGEKDIFIYFEIKQIKAAYEKDFGD